MRDMIITIVAHGEIASGKTRAINQMVEALKDEFEIIAQVPLSASIHNLETYSFKVRVR